MLFVFVAQADAAAPLAVLPLAVLLLLAVVGYGIAAGGTVVNCLCIVAGLPLLLVRTLYAFFLFLLFFLVCHVAAHPHIPPQFRRRRLQDFFPLAQTYLNLDGKAFHFF